MKQRLSFALDGAGNAVSVADVPSGLACRSFCPGCRKPLVAKKGPKQVHHFAHQGKRECAEGYETSLHLAVKTILERTKQIMLPDCATELAQESGVITEEGEPRPITELAYSYLEHDPRPTFKYADQFDRSYPRNGYSFLRGGLVTFDRITVEQREGRIVPDIIGYIRDKPIYIEVAVTHFVDDAKLAKVRQLDVSTIELDFSAESDRLLSWAELERILLTTATGRRWLWNKRGNDNAWVDREQRMHRMREHLADLERHEITHQSVFAIGFGSQMRVTSATDRHVLVYLFEPGDLTLGFARFFGTPMSFLIGRIGPGVSNLLSLIRRVSNLLRLSDHFYFAERAATESAHDVKGLYYSQGRGLMVTRAR